MPARKKIAVNEVCSEQQQENKNQQEQEQHSEPIVVKKRASRKKQQPTISIPENTRIISNVETGSIVKSDDVVKTTEMMERIKSKIEMFDKSEHITLLRTILLSYSAKLDAENGSSLESRQKAFDDFKRQVTQNKNGIFLNLTSCTDELWQSCVTCIERLERHHIDFEKLDKERQHEMEILVHQTARPQEVVCG